MKLQINGCEVSVTTNPETPLLYVLRNECGLTGTRFGCGEGLCGACMVLADDQAIFSCDTPLWSIKDRAITTIEGLESSPDATYLIDAFINEQAGQCGYCLSGIIIRTTALLRANSRPSRAEILEALDRNLCRCGSHARIIRAIERAAASFDEHAG